MTGVLINRLIPLPLESSGLWFVTRYMCVLWYYFIITVQESPPSGQSGGERRHKQTVRLSESRIQCIDSFSCPPLRECNQDLNWLLFWGSLTLLCSLFINCFKLCLILNLDSRIYPTFSFSFPPSVFPTIFIESSPTASSPFFLYKAKNITSCYPTLLLSFPLDLMYQLSILLSSPSHNPSCYNILCSPIFTSK